MQPNYHSPLLPEKIYHMFNRAVGSEQLFKLDENYFYFLRKYAEHVKEICDTYCYCLLPNHFHLLVKIKDEEQLAFYFEIRKGKKLPAYHNAILSDFLMERFSNWLNGYTKAFNKMYNRKGALFMDYTKRVQIEKDEGFSKLIHYIHANPVHHGLVKAIGEWQHSSYISMLSASPTLLLRKEVMLWFGGKNEFLKFHQQAIDLKCCSQLEL